MTLLQKLLTADVVCRDCGSEYGKYSVGCSSTWNGTCGVCGENKPITEVRDWGYLTKGIKAEKAKIGWQSLEVANYMKGQEEIASQGEDEPVSYEQGEITLMVTKEEIEAIRDFLGSAKDEGRLPFPDRDLESIRNKFADLYDDYCVEFALSPALKAYNEKYGTWGIGEDEARWEGFRDAFELLNTK